jgi:putative transposase
MDLNEQSKNKKRPRRKKDDAPPDPLEAYLRQIAKDGAGKPLSESLTEGSPLKQLIGRFVEIALEEEMREHLGYDPHERQSTTSEDQSPQRRQNTRNGRSRKRLRTSHGETEIHVPRDRAGAFEPEIVPKYGTITREVEDRVIAMYAAGMTTREIQSHVQELYGFDASEMFVSRIVERLDPMLADWRGRPLEAVCAVVFIDAIHLKVRHQTGVTSTAAYLISGYGEAGVMDVLGIYMAPEGHSPAESASFWHQVLVELEKRGLRDILILGADQLAGLEQAVESVYPRARFQPCVVHIVRNSLRRVPWTERKAVAREIKRIYQAATYEQAETALDELRTLYGKRHPAVVRQWTSTLPRLSDLWHYSTPLRKLVYTINPMENLNRQIRKVTKNRGVLPNPESAMRILTLILTRLDNRARQRVRPDWPRIANELSIHFPDRLPENWGLRT